jgi:hypothetical protein
MKMVNRIKKISMWDCLSEESLALYMIIGAILGAAGGAIMYLTGHGGGASHIMGTVVGGAFIGHFLMVVIAIIINSILSINKKSIRYNAQIAKERER